MTASLTKTRPEVIVALSKLLSKRVVDAARDQLADGTMYDIEAVVHLRGTVSVGEATETKQVNRLNPYVLMQLALSKLNGVTIDAFVAEAMALQKKLKSDDEDEDSPEMAEFKERVTAAMGKLTAGVLQRRRGGVSFDGEVTTTGERVSTQPTE